MGKADKLIKDEECKGRGYGMSNAEKYESIIFLSIIRHQPVHRISKGTAGLLVLNKMHVKLHSKLSEQIRSKVDLHSICR